MRYILFSLLLLLTFSLFAQDETSDTPQMGENPWLQKMPNFIVYSFDRNRDFDSCGFWDGTKLVTKEGRFWHCEYTLPEGNGKTSGLQLRRNITNALTAMKAKIIFQGPFPNNIDDPEFNRGNYNTITATASTKDGKNLWIEALTWDAGDRYWISIIEEEAMKQDMTGVELYNKIVADGYVSLHINFAINKVEIPSDFLTTVDQIVQMMKANPTLKLSIQGHTDNTGDVKMNAKLSGDRALSVKNELIKNGIEATRLTAQGFGSSKPVADNKTEEGRAQNRRVDLVKN